MSFGRGRQRPRGDGPRPESQRRVGGAFGDVGALIAAKHAHLVARHPALGTSNSPVPTFTAFDPTDLVLGRNEAGEPLLLPERPRLEHMHVIGATGSGKTNLLEHCIRQDVIHGRGVCVVDPHGNHPDSLYRSLLGWLDRNGFTKSRVIHLIDPNAHSHAIGFNPLGRPDANTSYSVIAEAMFEAFERMWGDEDGNTKPTIQRVLTATFTALGEQELTLAEARLLFDPDDTHGIRALVLQKLRDSYAHDEIDWLHRIGEERTGRRDFRAEVVGPINRIAKLVRNEAVRAIVGQTERVLDLREVMDENHIILANLSGGPLVYEQAADLLGRLLTRFLFFHARRRRHPERPFFVYLDEAHRYLSGDLPNIFAEIRKYGVGVAASHQWLAQTGRQDDPIREAICNGPNIKVVFRVRNPREAAELAESVIPLHLEMPVRALVKPTVVGDQMVTLRNWATSTSSGVTDTIGTGVTDSAAETDTAGENWGIAHAKGVTISKGQSIALGEAETTGTTRSVTTTEGGSETETDTSSESHTDSRGGGRSNDRNWSEASGRSTSYTQSMDPASTDWGDRTTSQDSSSGRGRGSSNTRNWSSADGYSAGQSHSSTTSWSRAEGVAHSESATRSRTVTESQGRAENKTTTKSRGGSASHATTKGKAVTNNTSHATSRGYSQSGGGGEAYRAVYADLPTAVHGKENALYLAAQELMSLPTGAARVAYVGKAGRCFARLKVPLVAHAVISDQEFDVLRVRILQESPAASPFPDAVACIKGREARLIEEAGGVKKLLPEPPSFRVPAPKKGRRGG